MRGVTALQRAASSSTLTTTRSLVYPSNPVPRYLVCLPTKAAPSSLYRDGVPSMLTHPNTDPSPHLSLALSSPSPSPNIHLAQGRVEGLLRRSPHELPARLERLLQVVAMCEDGEGCRRLPLLRALGQAPPEGG